MGEGVQMTKLTYVSEHNGDYLILENGKQIGRVRKRTATKDWVAWSDKMRSYDRTRERASRGLANYLARKEEA